MSKRFTDTKIWDDPWFQSLPIIWKCFWKYICDLCDEAGVWKVNKRQAEFQIGQKLPWDKMSSFLNIDKMRVVEFKDDVWVVKDFVMFQYGEKVLTSTHSFHERIRNTLKRYPIDTLSNTLPTTLLDRVKVIDKVKDKDILSFEFKEEEMQGKGNASTKIPPTVEQVEAYCAERDNNIDAQSFVDFYESKGWLIGKAKMKDWQAAVRTWEKNKKDEPTKIKYTNFLSGGDGGL